MSTADFRFIKPIAITDAMLTSSTVQEEVAATYAGGTTYALGDKAGLAPSVVGAPQLVYQSLSAGNVGNPLPVPPATSTAYWKYASSVYPAYSAAYTYALGGIASNITTNVHELYESLAAGNIGNALTDATKWLPLGVTNRWKMFDEIAASQTSNVGSLEVVLTPGTLINSAVFANLAGVSVRLQQSVSGYDRTVLLNKHEVLDWYDWFYEPIITRDEAAFMDVPPYAASSLTVTIDGGIGTASCGVAVFGQASYIGTTQWGLSRGINDYSHITEDQWGGLVLTPGNYSKLMNVDVHVPAGYESQVVHLLTSIRATAVMFVASEEHDSAVVYGTLGRGWNVPFDIAGGVARLEIRGLV